jgi:CO/xanthine dehydrogenase Mo-binding subunit
VYDPEAAMAPDAPILHPDLASYVAGHEWRRTSVPNLHAHVVRERGDVARGMDEADLVVEHKLRTALMHQGYLEPHACVVVAEGDGSARIWFSNKTTFRARDQLARALDLPREAVVIHHVPIGGDFGGKGSMMNAPLAYHLSRASGRPVAMVLTYAEELTAGQPRHPATVYLKTGVNRDGTIVAREGKVIYHRGAYAAFTPSPTGVLNGVNKLGGSYRIPHLRIEGLSVYTNQVPCGFMRAPGQPQVNFAVETHTDLVAAELGMDPLELRIRNVLRPGDETITGAVWRNGQGPVVLRRAAEAVGWGTTKGPGVGRGLALADRGIGGGEAHVEVELRPDGRVFVHTGAPDTGAGIYTVLRQIVAEELGLPPALVEVGTSDTSQSPYDPGAGASRTTHITGRAALDGAQRLRERLADLAAGHLGCRPDQVAIAGGEARAGGRAVDLATLAREAAARGDSLQVQGAYEGKTSLTSFIVQAAEVEVDSETGQVQVRRMASAHEVGTILNPLGHQGQIDGGVVQGLGSALMEGSALEEDGRLAAANLGDYKLPTIMDVPELITLHIEAPEGPAPYGGKSIGEDPFVPTAGAIVNAVRDATGVPVLEIPIKPEDLLRGLRERQRPE